MVVANADVVPAASEAFVGSIVFAEVTVDCMSEERSLPVGRGEVLSLEVTSNVGLFSMEGRGEMSDSFG